MSKELREQIRNNLILKDTYELLEIWKVNNHVEWSDLTFEVLREILWERIGEVPPQDEPILENKEIAQGIRNFEEWETRLLNNEIQPELYNPLEILRLRDNINKLIIGVVVVYILLALLNFQFVRLLFDGQKLPPAEILKSTPNMLITSLSVGLQIAITYFPLKAIVHILRILMEMEVNSRKAI
jgi:hypothetical protein